ncbi:hypothetical protein PTTG_25855 [Puccinia triticina 1-1 BBBD Race 1]|uniref:Uncharacterized protein n=1 Tax=Puccinia triticina (isolate 1-1 / race 1 (BBBD)) TaxID=630390 RepID=A0A180GZS1_PUCT1|nr:hypothetical protein PTTG_25855 [Puccinia triticina 1-1 BBBD Race 1]
MPQKDIGEASENTSPGEQPRPHKVRSRLGTSSGTRPKQIPAVSYRRGLISRTRKA